MPATVQALDALLAQSAASEEFKDAVREVHSTGRPAVAFQFGRSVPAVKAVRAITKLLEEEPALKIENATVEGSSGCSDFEGTIAVNGGDVKFDFRWCCAWRAEQEGLRDHWGHPDQIRAVREFGYQCFERFKRIG